MNAHGSRGTGKAARSSVTNAGAYPYSDRELQETASADAETVEERVDCGCSDSGGERERHCERRGRKHSSKLRATADQGRG